jgi:hypothetical protein
MSGYRGSPSGSGGGDRGSSLPRGGPPARSGGFRQPAHHQGPLTVITNCLRITQLPRKSYYHYDGE